MATNVNRLSRIIYIKPVGIFSATEFSSRPSRFSIRNMAGLELGYIRKSMVWRPSEGAGSEAPEGSAPSSSSVTKQFRDVMYEITILPHLNTKGAFHKCWELGEAMMWVKMWALDEGYVFRDFSQMRRLESMA